MKNTYHMDMDATPAEVFAWLDDSQRIMEWAVNIVENEDLEVTPERVGSTFRQVYEENGRQMEFLGRCTAYEQDRRIRVFLTGKMFDLDVDYHLEDLGGRTRLRQDSEVTFHGLMRFVGPLMCVFMKKNANKCLEDDFGRLKALAEGGRPVAS